MRAPIRSHSRPWLIAALAAGLTTLLGLRTTLCEPPPAAPPVPSSRAAFGIFYAAGAPEDEEALMQVLGAGTSQVARRFATFEEWAAADCDLLVFRGSDRVGLPNQGSSRVPWGHNLDPLKGKRVLGIGWEAVHVFAKLALELRGSATCESDRDSVVFQPNVLGGTTVRRRMEAFRAELLEGGRSKWTHEMLHMPPSGARAKKVEIIARPAMDDQYASLARQQNYVYCGISADVRTWTEPFRQAIHEVIDALRARPLEPFALAEHAVQAPGLLDFTLPRTSLDGSRRTFYFRFERPTLFSAVLSQTGSRDTMLLFMAEQSESLRDMERLDGKSGETLRILIPITSECIRENEGRYWTLDVDNFDPWSPAKCTLRVDYVENASVQFPDGLTIAMANPPSDEKTIRTLIERLQSPDLDERLLAATALAIVGQPALPFLQSVQASLAGRDERLRIAHVISSITGGS